MQFRRIKPLRWRIRICHSTNSIWPRNWKLPSFPRRLSPPLLRLSPCLWRLSRRRWMRNVKGQDIRQASACLLQTSSQVQAWRPTSGQRPKSSCRLLRQRLNRFLSMDGMLPRRCRLRFLPLSSRICQSPRWIFPLLARLSRLPPRLSHLSGRSRRICRKISSLIWMPFFQALIIIRSPRALWLRSLTPCRFLSTANSCR
ncbi:hypothetical protein D3C80_827880 [compost metagenome]